MSKRDAIVMTPEEQRAMLDEKQTIILTTIGKDGYPHSVAMWFTVDDDGAVWMATYGKSQKVVNLRRNPKVSLLVEEGVEYDQLKGVLIRGDAEVVEDDERTFQVLRRIFLKTYGELAEQAEAVLKQRAVKRVAVRVTPRKVASWDHTKSSNPY